MEPSQNFDFTPGVALRSVILYENMMNVALCGAICATEIVENGQT